MKLDPLPLLEAIHRHAMDDEAWASAIVAAFHAQLPSFERGGGLSPYQRRVLSRVALYLENAHRSRQCARSIRGVLTPEDVLVPRTFDVPRGLWSAVVRGRVSFVTTHSEHGTSLLVLDNDPSRHAVRALTQMEARIVELASRGFSTKLIGYEVGLSPSVVSQQMASAAAKVGVLTHADLVRVVRLTSDKRRLAFPTVNLTSAERAVLELIRRGFSNRRIATLRSRSVRTVANQVASILRKTSTPSRRALIASDCSDHVSCSAVLESTSHDRREC